MSWKALYFQSFWACCGATCLGKPFLCFWPQNTSQFLSTQPNYFPFCFTAQSLASQCPHCIHPSLHRDWRLGAIWVVPLVRESDHRRKDNMLQDLCSAQASSHHPPQVAPWPHTKSLPRMVHLSLQLYFLCNSKIFHWPGTPTLHLNSFANKEAKAGCRACINALKYDTGSATEKLPSFVALFVPPLLRPPV